MRVRKIFIVGFLLLVAGGIQTHAQPKLPFYDWGAGPCEYCLYGEWTAKKEVPIFQRRDSRSKVAFVAKKGDKLTATTGVVVTTHAGLGKVIEPTTMAKFDKATDRISFVSVDRNQTFHILTYHGEGNYTVWLKGKLLVAGLESRELKILKAPQFVWWIKIKNSKGQVGWTRMARDFNAPHEV